MSDNNNQTLEEQVKFYRDYLMDLAVNLGDISSGLEHTIQKAFLAADKASQENYDACRLFEESKAFLKTCALFIDMSNDYIYESVEEVKTLSGVVSDMFAVLEKGQVQ